MKPADGYSDAKSAFVMVWLYQPSGRSPIGGPNAKTTKTIDGTSYQIFAGPRNSGSDGQRPVISYVTNSMNKTFNIKPILDDASANAAAYGVWAIPNSYLVTDIFFGVEVWTGSAASGLGVTNFSVAVQ